MPPYDNTDVNAFDDDVESFKKFCLENKPLESRPKVQVDHNLLSHWKAQAEQIYRSLKKT